MTSSADPRDILKTAPMSPLQIAIVAITIALNALDGFDVMSISYASPGISKEWNLPQGGLGLVLSMELIGMAIGSIVIGNIADRIGRRPTMLICLGFMSLGMLMATTAGNPTVLSVWRVVTGLGIGGMLAAINAVSAEFANERRKHLSVSLMSIGYPIGAVFGGLGAARLLQTYDWRSVFYLGTVVTILLIPVVYFVIPESVHWLARKQPVGALDKINRAMVRMGHQAIAALPAISPAARLQSAGDIFGPAMIATTMLVTLAYFFHIVTFYYIVKWVPKIVVDMGFIPSTAAQVLMWTNVGGATGGAIFGFLTLRYGVKALTIATLVLSTVMVSIFGKAPADLQTLIIICTFCGFFINAGIVGLYAIIAQAFPTHVRASGTGFAIGAGRGGSVLAPIIAGYLFQFGFTLPTVSFALGAGSILGAVMLLLLKLEDRTAPEPAALKPART
jgi:benzoate transport